ncbi:MAG TPA: HDOD domain-containing protein [Candidatus Latescibacteria bacterium]|nr:HDOD domain-containing protein [Candidatus Latescibacterota bacterium]
MPAAHSKLLVLLGKADAEIDLNLVSSTLAQDPALSAKVMRTSRSAFHGFQGNILSQPVVFLGASAMKDRAHQRHRRPHHGYRL